MKLELTINELKNLMNANVICDMAREREVEEVKKCSSKKTYYIATYAELLNNGDICTVVTCPYLDKMDAIKDILNTTWDDCVTLRETIETELYEWNISHPQYINKNKDDKESHMCYEIHLIRF